MLRIVLLVATSLSLAFAPAPFPRAERRAGLKGRWGPHLIAEGGLLTYNPGPGQTSYRLRVDSARRPEAFDLCPLEGGPPEFLSIYRVRGDTLTLSYNPAARGRPTAFAGPGSGRHNEFFTRKNGRLRRPSPGP